jgi:hypothetical protein
MSDENQVEEMGSGVSASTSGETRSAASSDTAATAGTTQRAAGTDSVSPVAEIEPTACQIIELIARRVATPPLVQPKSKLEPRRAHRSLRIERGLWLRAINEAKELLGKLKGEQAKAAVKRVRFVNELAAGADGTTKFEVLVERPAVNALIEIVKPSPLPGDFEVPVMAEPFGVPSL